MTAIPNVLGGPSDAFTSEPLRSPAGSRSTNEVVRITAADVLPPANLQPPTAQTFDELGIPAPLRAAAEKALTTNEKMLWVGRPSRNRQVHPPCPIPPAIGIGLIVLAGVIFVAVLGSAVLAAKGSGFPVFGLFFAGVLGLIGAAIVFLPALNHPEKLCRYCYVVTNRRALLVEQTLLGTNVQTYLPQQLLGLERRDHAEVAGAGDLVFEYITTLGGEFNPNTFGFMQQTPTAPSTKPQRVPRGFVCLDQVREVEDLIRTSLLLQLEQALDGAEVCATTCPCGVTLQAPPVVAGKSVKCPRCTAIVTMPADDIDNGQAFIYREDRPVPVDLKEKILAGLDRKEKPVWVGQPNPNLVLLRNSGYFAFGGVGILIAILWLVVSLLPVSAAAPRVQPGNKAVAAAPAVHPGISVMVPLGVFLVSACIAAVPYPHWRSARRTCYAVTNRRAVVYTEGLFGVTRDSYTPLEVSNMRRSNSWLARDSGDLIFRTVHVISRSRRGGRWSDSIRTIHYGLLAIDHLDEVERLVRETLIDPFVDRLNQAGAQA
jgi:hypothetical protein